MSDFTQQQIDAVWEKALPVPNRDSTQCRKDIAGAWIIYKEYGKKSEMGWTIDHIMPLAKNGPTILENLQALQHQNNSCKGDDYPIFKTKITAKGERNIEFEQTFKASF